MAEDQAGRCLRSQVAAGPSQKRPRGTLGFVEEKTYLPKTATGGFAAFSAVGPETGKIFKVPFVIVVR